MKLKNRVDQLRTLKVVVKRRGAEAWQPYTLSVSRPYRNPLGINDDISALLQRRSWETALLVWLSVVLTCFIW